VIDPSALRQGNLSPALTKQFLPARAALLADYWQKTVDRTVEKWRFAETDVSSAYNDYYHWHLSLIEIHCSGCHFAN
jgi:hypothetical protein